MMPWCTRDVRKRVSTTGFHAYAMIQDQYLKIKWSWKRKRLDAIFSKIKSQINCIFSFQTFLFDQFGFKLGFFLLHFMIVEI